MSQANQVSRLAQRTADEFKKAAAKRGPLETLTTNSKANLVAAINELEQLTSNATNINDVAAGDATTYSSDKILALILGLETKLLGPGVPDALNTLQELASELTENNTEITQILEAQAHTVKFDSVQTLTALQRTQARTNIGAASAEGVGNTDTDFVAIFEAELAA